MNKTLYILLITASQLLWSFATASAQTSVQEAAAASNTAISGALIDAVTEFQDGKYESARSRFSDITDVDPLNDAAFYYLGLCDYYLSDPKDSEAHLREAVSLDSTNFWYSNALASVYASNGKVDEALGLYEKMIAAQPKKVDLYYSVVNLYARQQKFDKVLETLSSIDAIAGPSENITLARYDILLRLNRDQEAFEGLRKFTEDYSSPQVLSYMGDFQMAHDNDSLALKYFSEALSEQPGLTYALVGKSRVYLGERNYPEFFRTANAIVENGEDTPYVKTNYLRMLMQAGGPNFFRDCQAGLDSLMDCLTEKYPSDTSSLALAGSYYYSTERQDRGIGLFRQNCEQNPGNLDFTAMYLQSLSSSERWAELADACEKYAPQFPEMSDFHSMRTYALYNLKDYRGVIAECEKIIRTFPNDTSAVVSAYSSKGDIHYMLGEREKAYKAYAAALKLDPKYAPVLNNYAYYLSLEGKNLKKAYNMSSVAVEQDPDNSTYLDTLGWILYLRGMAKEAKPYFKHAMLYGGKESATVLDHYAEVLYALKEYDLAKMYWNMAVQKDTEHEIEGLEERVQTKLKAVGK
jgi:pentatricopeptide repeat protein